MATTAAATPTLTNSAMTAFYGAKYNTIEEVSPDIMLAALISTLKMEGGIGDADLIKFFVINALKNHETNEEGLSCVAQTIGKVPERTLDVLTQINWSKCFAGISDMPADQWLLFKRTKAQYGKGVRMLRKSVLIGAGAKFVSNGIEVIGRINVDGAEVEVRGQTEAEVIDKLEAKNVKVNNAYHGVKLMDIDPVDKVNLQGLRMEQQHMKIQVKIEKIRIEKKVKGKMVPTVVGYRATYGGKPFESRDEARPDRAEKRLLTEIMKSVDTARTDDDIWGAANKKAAEAEKKRVRREDMNSA